MKITVISSEYVVSAVGKNQYPKENLPEIVFIGRSNVGKSSLINSLTGRKNLARVSQTPGKTQTINFYRIKLKVQTDDSQNTDENNAARREFYLVDLPGYGYAKTSKSSRKVWSKFIEEYLLNSKNIKFLCQLIDIRHAPMESDLKTFDWIIESNLSVLIVATKADKISKAARDKQAGIIKAAFDIPELPVLPYSSVKNDGRAELLEVIGETLMEM